MRTCSARCTSESAAEDAALASVLPIIACIAACLKASEFQLDGCKPGGTLCLEVALDSCLRAAGGIAGSRMDCWGSNKVPDSAWMATAFCAACSNCHDNAAACLGWHAALRLRILSEVQVSMLACNATYLQGLPYQKSSREESAHGSLFSSSSVQCSLPDRILYSWADRGAYQGQLGLAVSVPMPHPGRQQENKPEGHNCSNHTSCNGHRFVAL